ncbi:MAG: hypothetical protein GY725_15360 [bacterium]|nr:hypothetical protein [bacterium]
MLAIRWPGDQCSGSGRIAYALRHPWRDGTTHIVFEPAELLEKRVALVPRPRAHLVRHHGVLAPGARLRPGIVKSAQEAEAAQESARIASATTAAQPRAPTPQPSGS